MKKTATVPLFETQRLILKEITLQDVPNYEKYFINYDVIGPLSAQVPWPYPENGVSDFLHAVIFPQQGKTIWSWGIFEKQNPQILIGGVQLFRNDKPENRGFWLGKPFWGKGYMTEAVAPVMDYAFENLGFEKLRFANAVGNTKSRRVKEKTGARLIQIGPGAYVNPEFTQQELWELTKAEWNKFNGRV